MLKVTALIFGEYSHGKLKGHVNPNESVEFTGQGRTPKEALSSLGHKVFSETGKYIQTEMPIYKIIKVVDLKAT